MIGRLQIWPTPRILPKWRLLIGRELRMLASHWSRGPSEIFQRSYPYNSKSVPIECFLTQMTMDWFIDDCFTRPLASIEASARVKDPSMKLYYRDRVPINRIIQIGIPLAVNWHSIVLLRHESNYSDWHDIGTGLVHRWLFYSATCLYRAKCPSKGSLDEARFSEINLHSIGKLAYDW